MKPSPKILKPQQLVILYALICGVFAFSLHTLQLPIAFLTLMMVPVIWAILYYPINLCVLMLGIFGLISVVFSYYSNEVFGTALISVLISILAFALVLFLIDSAIVRQHTLEEELHLVHERLSTSLDSTQFGIWDWNLETGEVYLSSHAMSMLGQSRSSIQLSISDFQDKQLFQDAFPAIHPQDLEMIQKEIHACMEGKHESYRVEYRALDSEGDFRWVMGRGSAFRDTDSGTVNRITGSVVDIQQQKITEMELTISEARYQNLVDEKREGICIYDGQASIVYANPAMENILGVPRGTLLGSNFIDFMDKTEFQRFHGETRKYINKQSAATCDVSITRPDGVCRSLHVTTIQNPNDKGESMGIVGIFQDVTDDAGIEKQLMYANTHDGMTGLYNRAYYEKELERLEIKQVAPVSVIVLDLDNLKKVNEKLGEQFGDAIIKEMANVLRISVRDKDTVARIGGDEFAIILPDVGPEALQKVIKRIEMNTEYENATLGRQVELQFSIGGDTNYTGCNLNATVAKADASMYREKRLKQKL